MSETVTIHRAKTTLSQLVARAEAGEEIIIARGGTPVAKLVPIQPLDESFWDPLPEDELRAWEARDD
jgi:prevent-host-death family protein